MFKQLGINDIIMLTGDNKTEDCEGMSRGWGQNNFMQNFFLRVKLKKLKNCIEK